MPVYRVYTGALWCNIGLYRAIPIMTSPKCVVKIRRVCVGLVFVFLFGLSMASDASLAAVAAAVADAVAVRGRGCSLKCFFIIHAWTSTPVFPPSPWHNM